MKAIIEIKTPEEAGMDSGSITFYKTKEEWGASYYSYKSMMERTKDKHIKTALEMASREPSQYPCLAIQGDLIEKSNGPDEISFTFIYDFMLVVKGKVIRSPNVTITNENGIVNTVDNITGEKIQSADGTNWTTDVIWKPEMYNSSPGITNPVSNKNTQEDPTYKYLNVSTDPLEEQKFTIYWKGGGYSIVIGKDVNDAFTTDDFTCHKHQHVSRIVHYTLEKATNYVLDKNTNTFIAQN